jgi:hypothetical protein
MKKWIVVIFAAVIFFAWLFDSLSTIPSFIVVLATALFAFYSAAAVEGKRTQENIENIKNLLLVIEKEKLNKEDQGIFNSKKEEFDCIMNTAKSNTGLDEKSRLELRKIYFELKKIWRNNTL